VSSDRDWLERSASSGSNVGQVLADRNAELAAGFDDAEDCGDFGTGFLAADVQPLAIATSL